MSGASGRERSERYEIHDNSKNQSHHVPGLGAKTGAAPMLRLQFEDDHDLCECCHLALPTMPGALHAPQAAEVARVDGSANECQAQGELHQDRLMPIVNNFCLPSEPECSINFGGNAMKYIVVVGVDRMLPRTPVVFPETVQHAEIAALCKGLRAVSGGFCALKPDGTVIIHGAAKSLDLTPHAGDYLLLTALFGVYETTTTT